MSSQDSRRGGNIEPQQSVSPEPSLRRGRDADPDADPVAHPAALSAARPSLSDPGRALVGTPGFEVLFHASPMGVGFTVERELREVNDRLCAMTGYAREELIGQSLRMLHPSEAAFEAIGEIVYPRLCEEPVVRVDAKLKRKDGRILDVALCLALVQPQEPARGVIATVLDVTDYLRTQAELHAARARLETALAAGDLGLYEGDMITGEVEVDARCRSQLGLPPTEPMTVERWLALVHPEDGERLRAAVADTIAGRVSVLDTEYRIRHADGGWRWLFDCWQVYSRDGAGRVQRIVGVHMDITQRKAAEQALAELNRTLEARVAERTAEVQRQAAQLRALASQLTRTEQRERKRLATILHDHIQQLIVAAQIQASQLARAVGTEPLRAAAGAVGETLSEALAASRSLTVELSPPVLQERGLVGGLNWLALRMREQHGLTVDVRAEPDAEPPSDEMRFLLFECARELLVNVLKHAAVGRAALTFARLPAGELRLRVTDEGAGFEPNSLRELEPEAMSFGLFSIRERLAHLGGRMELETAPGLGTSVALFVPGGDRLPAAADRQAGASRTGAGAYAVRQRAPRWRVVIVDDHRIVREGIAGLLRVEADIEVVGEAETGAQALALAAELKPDVIIMDINLGTGMDGIEATRRVLATAEKITVIGLSMHVDRDVADAMLAAGAAAYLTKGGPPEDLIGAIRKHAGSRGP